MLSTLTTENLKNINIVPDKQSQPPKPPSQNRPPSSTGSDDSLTSTDLGLLDPLSPGRLGPGPVTPPPPLPALPEPGYYLRKALTWDAWDPWAGAEPDDDPISPPFEHSVPPRWPRPVYRPQLSPIPEVPTPLSSPKPGPKLFSRPIGQEMQSAVSSTAFSLLDSVLWPFTVVIRACFCARRKEQEVSAA